MNTLIQNQDIVFISWFALLVIHVFAPSSFTVFWRSFSKPVPMYAYKAAMVIGFLTFPQ